MLVQLVSRDHLDAVLERNISPNVVVYSPLHMEQLLDDLLLYGDHANELVRMIQWVQLRLNLLRADLAYAFNL